MDSAEQPVTVSVVTPSYNQGQYLAATIESVLAQEGDFRLDYLVIDGGSADDSVEVIKRYEAMLNGGEWPVRCRDIRYRWVSEKDRGQSDAIVKGFGLAEGAVLAWLNSDDTYLAGALARVVEFFSKHPDTDLVYGKGHYIDVRGEIIGRYPAEPFDYGKLAMFNFICQPAAFFRKKAYDEVGGLDRGLRYTMDYELWIRLAATCRVGYLPEFLATYRLHEESKTMAPADAAAFHEEVLKTTMKYYGWAPLNRVYGCCNTRVRAGMAGLARFRALVVVVSLCYAVARYLVLNRGIRLDDVKMLTMRNLRKLSRDWSDLYKDY